MPHEKTALFIAEYERLYSSFYRRYVDIVDCEKMKGTLRSTTKQFGAAEARDRKIRREYSAFWNRRQMADCLGIKYNIFIHYAMEAHMSVARKKLPSPNQLLSGGGGHIVLDHVMKAWEQHGSSEKISYKPQYRSEYYVGLPAQDEHRNGCWWS